jgi:hypothetical protein
MNKIKISNDIWKILIEYHKKKQHKAFQKMECSQLWTFVLQTALQVPPKYSTNLVKDIYVQGKIWRLLHYQNKGLGEKENK